MKSPLYRFAKGFYYAAVGIQAGFRQRNMRVHGFIFLLVISAGLVYRISSLEWILISIVSSLVLALELINSSIEELADLVRDHHRLGYQATKTLRDMSAGAVLIAAVSALFVGLIIFIPKLATY